MKKVLAMVLLAYTAMATGCWRTTVMDGKARKGPDKELGNTFIVYGLVNMGEESINAAEHCGAGGLKGVEFQHSLIDSILTTITFGIYSPITVKLYCRGSRAAADDPSHPPSPMQVASNGASIAPVEALSSGD